MSEMGWGKLMRPPINPMLRHSEIVLAVAAAAAFVFVAGLTLAR